MNYKLFFICACAILCLASCNPIPDKSIFERLDSKELAKAMKADSTFEEFYKYIERCTDGLGEIEKAKYNDITYRKLHKVLVEDSSEVRKEKENWAIEWKEIHGDKLAKVDSVVDYWKDYQEKNSLDRFVKIEFAELNKTYYEYIGGVEDLQFGFRLTPLEGKVEQVSFRYKYGLKLNCGQEEWHHCICSSPISKSTVKYWDGSYHDKDNLANKNSQTFLRDYNIDIEVTGIRKDGQNYSIYDLEVPNSVKFLLEYVEKKDTLMVNYYKGRVVKETIDKDYLREYEYIYQHYSEYMKQRYPREYEFLHLKD